MSFDGCCHGGLRRGAFPNAMTMVVCDVAPARMKLRVVHQWWLGLVRIFWLLRWMEAHGGVNDPTTNAKMVLTRWCTVSAGEVREWP